MRFTFGLVKGALIGGVVAVVGTVIVVMILAVLSGDSPLYGLTGALYYSGVLLVFFCPAGLLIGAVIASIVIVWRSAKRSENAGRSRWPAYVLWLGVPLLLLVALVYVPYRLTGVETVVTHGATWTVDSTLHSDCATPVTLVILHNYATYEEICSPNLLSYLQAQEQSVVPVQYRVTSDFGQVRGYQLIRIGDIDINWDEWIGGAGSCGSQYMPPCDSPQAHLDSSVMLTTSSWPEVVPTLEQASGTSVATPATTSAAPPA